MLGALFLIALGMNHIWCDVNFTIRHSNAYHSTNIYTYFLVKYYEMSHITFIAMHGIFAVV
jgi:hypothetical protein